MLLTELFRLTLKLLQLVRKALHIINRLNLGFLCFEKTAQLLPHLSKQPILKSLQFTKRKDA